MGKVTCYHPLVRGDDSLDLEIEVDVSSWGSSGSGPSWNHPGDPPEPPEYEITSVTVDGVKLDPPLTQEETQTLDEHICLAIAEDDDDGYYPEDYDD
jgi:hypothetical protein